MSHRSNDAQSATPSSTRPLHVVFMTADFTARGSGGIGTYIDALGRGLARVGHRVTVLTAQPGRPTDGSYEVGSVDGGGFTGPRRRLQMADAFRDALLDLDHASPVDVCEATDYGMEAMACLAAGGPGTTGIPMVVRMHTPDSLVCELNGEIRLTDSPAVHAVEGAYFRSARHVSSPSQAMADEAAARWGVVRERITVLPNPVATRGPAPPSTGRAAGRFRLCSFGRLERRKGTDLLAEALRTIMPRHPGLEVDFVGADTRTGDAPHSRHLRSVLKPWSDRVRFTGFLDSDASREVLASADAVCLPSRWENFPYACLEAIAAGRPVIATSGSGFEEIVDAGLHGLLVPPDDPDALSAAIDKVVDGSFEASIEQLVRRAADFDVSRLVPRFERYYRQVAA